MKLTALILLNLLSVSAIAQKSNSVDVKRLDILEFKPNQRVFIEGANSKGTVTKISGNCDIGNTSSYDVQLDNGRTQTFCGSNELGPIPNSWNYSFRYDIPLALGKTLTITDQYWNPGKIVVTVKIEEILIGVRMSNADPERKIIINGIKSDGEKTTILLNNFSYSQYQFRLD